MTTPPSLPCPQCGFEAPRGSHYRFCTQCGAALNPPQPSAARVCPKCSHTAPTGSRYPFCTHCGGKLPPPTRGLPAYLRGR